MTPIDFDDQRDWPPDLALWFNAQDDERRGMWRTNALFAELTPEEGLIMLDKIMGSDDYGEAVAKAGRGPDDDYLTDGELLAKVMQESQEAADVVIQKQNAANALRDADTIRTAIDENADDN